MVVWKIRAEIISFKEFKAYFNKNFTNVNKCFNYYSVTNISIF